MRDLRDYTSRYLEKDFENYIVYYRNKHTIKSVENYKRKDSILEIGCGMDPLFPFIEGFKKYVVVEPGEIFYDNSVKEAGDDKRICCLNIPFSATDFLRSQNFDVIICSSLIHELEDPKWFLNEIQKVCSYNTIVHLNAPNAYSVHRLIALEMGLINDVHSFSDRNIAFQQHTVFDLESLSNLARTCGFDVVSSGSYFIKPFSHDQLSKMMDCKIIDERVLDGLDRLSKYIPQFGCDIYVDLKLATV